MVSTTKDPLTFNDLMATPIGFFKYVLNRLKIDNLTQDLLLGPAYDLLKGTCTSSIKLEYNFQECFNALTDKLDWNNPEGDCSLRHLTPLRSYALIWKYCQGGSSKLNLHDHRIRQRSGGFTISSLMTNSLAFLALHSARPSVLQLTRVVERGFSSIPIPITWHISISPDDILSLIWFLTKFPLWLSSHFLLLSTPFAALDRTTLSIRCDHSETEQHSSILISFVPLTDKFQSLFPSSTLRSFDSIPRSSSPSIPSKLFHNQHQSQTSLVGAPLCDLASHRSTPRNEQSLPQAMVILNLLRGGRISGSGDGDGSGDDDNDVDDDDDINHGRGGDRDGDLHLL
ncbi:hypothetical protein Tco_0633411 [Tanacetum coccineum]